MPPRHAYWTILVDNQPTAFRAHEAEELQPTLNRLKEKHPSAVMMWFERGRLWESREAARAEFPARSDRRGPSGRREDRSEARPEQHSRDEGGEGDARPPRDPNWRPGGDHKDPRQKYKDAKKAKWQRFKQNVRARHEERRERSRPPGDEAPPRSDGRDAPREDRRRKSDGARGGWKPKGPPRERAEFKGRDDRPPRGTWQDRERPGGDRPRGNWRDDRSGGWRPKGPPPGEDNRQGREERKPWPKRESRTDEWRNRPSRDNDRSGDWRERPARDRDRPTPDWRDRPPRDSDRFGEGRDRPPRDRDRPKPEWRDRPKPEWRDRDRPKPDWRDNPGGDRREDRRFEDRRGPGARTGDRRPWGTKPGAPKGPGRKPWGSKPHGAGPSGRKPFGSGNRPKPAPGGPRRPRGPKKPRDDE
jgi:hypothetical protein